MLVKIIENAYQLQDEFRRFDRDYYSIEGYQALLDLFEETDCGEPTDCDVIGLCCDFTEADPETIMNDYGWTINEMSWTECIADGADYDDMMDSLVDKIYEHSWAVRLSNGNILYQNF